MMNKEGFKVLNGLLFLEILIFIEDVIGRLGQTSIACVRQVEFYCYSVRVTSECPIEVCL